MGAFGAGGGGFGLLGEFFERALGGFGFVAAEDVVGEAAEQAAEDGGEPEEPELREGPVAAEEGGGGGAGGVDREVGDGDADEVDEGEAKANGDGCEALRSRRRSVAAHDDEEEHESEHRLGDEAGGERIMGRGVFAVTVGSAQQCDLAEIGDGTRKVLSGGNDVKARGANRAADQLGEDIGHQIFGGEAFASAEADGDGGIEMAAGDVADGVSHGEDGESDGEGDADEADAEGGEGGGGDGGANAGEDQPEGADELGEAAFADGWCVHGKLRKEKVRAPESFPRSQVYGLCGGCKENGEVRRR